MKKSNIVLGERSLCKPKYTKAVGTAGVTQKGMLRTM